PETRPILAQCKGAACHTLETFQRICTRGCRPPCARSTTYWSPAIPEWQKCAELLRGVVPLVGYHLAIVRQGARIDGSHLAAQLGHVTQRSLHRRRIDIRTLAGFDQKSHDIARPLAPDDQPATLELGMTCQ